MPHSMNTHPWLTVVGLGEDGFSGLGEAARTAIDQAQIIFGGARHLALIPQQPGQQCHPWPRPFEGAYQQILSYRGQRVCVLASGDPMWHGIGARLVNHIALDELRILPAPSAITLAAARMGWAVQDITVIPVHSQSLAQVHLHLAPKARLVALSANSDTPRQLAALLVNAGFGDSQMTLFEHLGGSAERRVTAPAAEWRAQSVAALNLVAVDCDIPSVRAWSRRASLPDAAFDHDGQLTKRDVRALTLARLAPVSGELLWDVGAGCGSIGIEWLRAIDRGRCLAIEANPERCARIRHNCAQLGVPELEIMVGTAPVCLAGLEPPDAIFIGGGVTVNGMIEHCWAALKPGGRLVVNAVTLQSEAVLITWRERVGGELTRVQVAQAEPLGRFDGWRTAYPVTLFTAVKSAQESEHRSLSAAPNQPLAPLH